MNREYPPGFSPAEIAARKNRNPEDVVKERVQPIATRLSMLHTELQKNTKHLEELCKNWSAECYDDYIETIHSVCYILDEFEYLGKQGQYIRELHYY